MIWTLAVTSDPSRRAGPPRRTTSTGLYTRYFAIAPRRPADPALTATSTIPVRVTQDTYRSGPRYASMRRCRYSVWTSDTPHLSTRTARLRARPLMPRPIQHRAPHAPTSLRSRHSKKKQARARPRALSGPRPAAEGGGSPKTDACRREKTSRARAPAAARARSRRRPATQRSRRARASVDPRDRARQELAAFGERGAASVNDRRAKAADASCAVRGPRRYERK